MNKKSMQRSLPAFSLAEALITLLIVCLITIASIPILTKKRRDLSNGGHGKYYCTLNSDGNYVEYKTQSPEGDVDDPDTWKEVKNTGYKDTVTYKVNGKTVTKNRFQCKFTPPKNARNFNVTVIGGGAAGHNGTAEFKSLLNVTSAGSGTFTATQDDEYYDIILASGGGGGGGASEDGSGGPGGGGGSGGVIRAEGIKLVKYANYSYQVGGGGGGAWGVKRGCCKPNKTDHDRAGSGGESFFRGNSNGVNINFTIPGAIGGDSVGCTKKKCRGGGAGWGPSYNEITMTYGSKRTGATVTKSAGKNGEAGGDYCGGFGCDKILNIKGGQNSIDSFQLDNNNYPIELSIGSGGYGRRYPGFSIQGLSGSAGGLIISQTNKIYGNGGNAGQIQSKFVPSIEGYVISSIPLAAEPNNAGQAVYATLYKNKTNNGILLRADGGSTPGTNKTGPTAGGDSPWTYKHGGAIPAKCDSPRDEGAGYEDVPKEVLKCKAIGCELDEFNLSFLQSNNKTSSSTSAVLPAGMREWSTNESAYIDAYYDTLPLSSASGTNLKNYLDKLNILYTDAEKAEGMIQANGSLSTYNNASDFNNQGCFFDEGNLEYIRVCASEGKEQTTEKVWHGGRRVQKCYDGGDGQVFGAGGGGGNAGDIPGAYSKGGKGAPGAVIIEW